MPKTLCNVPVAQFERFPENGVKTGIFLTHTVYGFIPAVPLSAQEIEVLKTIKALRSEFYTMEDKAIELAERQWTVNEFTRILRRLPPRYKDEHIHFIIEHAPCLSSAKCVEEIFQYLDLYWSFLSSSLLKCILDELGDPTAIQQMREFIVKVEQFRRITPIHVFFKVECVDVASQPVHPQLMQLVTDHKPESLTGSSTLEDVEEFRKTFAITYTIDKVALCIAKISSGCTTMNSQGLLKLHTSIIINIFQ